MTIEELCQLSWQELLEWDEKKIQEHFANALKLTRPPEKVINKQPTLIPDGPIKPPDKKPKSSVKQTQLEAQKLIQQFQALMNKPKV